MRRQEDSDKENEYEMDFEKRAKYSSKKSPQNAKSPFKRASPQKSKSPSNIKSALRKKEIEDNTTSKKSKTTKSKLTISDLEEASNIVAMLGTETKGGKEKKDKFDEPMLEFMETNLFLTKAFAMSLALRLNLFNILEAKGNIPLSAPKIAELLKLQIPVRQVMIFLDKLVVHNYLEKEGIMFEAEYKNSAFTTQYLTDSSEDSYVSVFNNVERYFRKLAVSDNNMIAGNINNIFDEVYSTEEETENFVELYYKVNQINFTHLLQKFDFGKYKTVLDLRGGNGDLGAKIKNAYTDIEMISMDNKMVEKLYLQHMDKINMLANATFIPYDILTDEIPNSDVVILPHLLQYYFEEDKKKILKKVYKSLDKKGVLIVMENMLNPELQTEQPASKISFVLTFQNYEGYNMTVDEYKDLLTEIGFKLIQHLKQDWTSDLIFAKK